jgi:large subunit ribosomal protein L25
VSEVKIAAELRTEFGKGAARRLRRADKVPAVLYGHGADPVHLSLPTHDTALALKNPNALLTLDIQGGSSEMALPKHVQRDPIRGFIKHVDLILVRRGEKVTVDIAVHVTGDAVAGTMISVENPTISIEAEATHIPTEIEVSVEGLDVGSQIHAKDLKLPAGSTLAADEELLVVNVTATPTAEDLEGAAEVTEGEGAVGEGETAEEASAEGEGSSDES